VTFALNVSRASLHYDGGVDQEAQDPRGRAAQEDEPERQMPLRTPPPPKKPLEQFLREFEERLQTAPSEPATGAGAALVERAEGSRRSPVESQSDRPRLRWRPAAGPPPAPLLPAATPAQATPAQEVAPETRKRRHRRRRRRR